MTKKTKIISITSAIVVVALAVFVFFRFYFVFGEGVKAGTLNYVVYKGYIFKTYEGKMIQSGFRGSKTGNATIQSYEFEFSVADAAIADSLMHYGGREVELHYKEYLGTLPWRGVHKHVVDRIEAVH
mgnify:CR=1 FL=1